MTELPPLGELLARNERSVVHLSLRDTYCDPAEAKRVAAWRAGHRDAPPIRRRGGGRSTRTSPIPSPAG
ncbi:DUF6879 family protein [Actinomadura sp. 9N215]|uniref:DUF6879 family protein n=1 Tax=Actinomadura sp. 9N215 TaxID=3375150 RepID=UPI0037BCBB89